MVHISRKRLLVLEISRKKLSLLGIFISNPGVQMKQRQIRKANCSHHDQQESGVQHSYVQIPAGNHELYLSVKHPLTIAAVGFKAEEKDAEPDPLRMENFCFYYNITKINVYLLK